MSSKKDRAKRKKLTKGPFRPRKSAKKPKFAARPYKPKSPKKKTVDEILKNARAERAALVRRGITKTKSSGREAVRPRPAKLKMNAHSQVNRDPAGYYSMLEVNPDATIDEIIRSYQKVISVARMNNLAFIEKLAQQAFDTLTNERLRQAYDPAYGIADGKPRKPPTDVGFTWSESRIMGSLADMSGESEPEPKSWWERLLD
jgi:hypothetical protein